MNEDGVVLNKSILKSFQATVRQFCNITVNLGMQFAL